MVTPSRRSEAFEVPFYVNGMARGSIPFEHPGLMSRSRKFALGKADVVFIFGTPFDFRLEYGRAIGAGAKIVQIDLDGAELGRNRRVDVAIHGDSGIVLKQLVDAAKAKKAPAWLASFRDD